MATVLIYLPIFMCGLGAGAVFYFWRKASARWATWFPLLKKLLEWGFIGLGLADVVYAFYYFNGSSATAGPALLALVVGVVLPEAFLRQTGGASSKEETKRGALMGNSLAVARKIKAAKTPAYLSLGGVPVPVDAEPYHFLIAGSTGTGKSVAINTLLQKIRARGDCAIVVDSGGNFLAKHFQADTDFVFNPYDDRCVGWSPTAEMQGVWDCLALARSIVPDGVGDGKEWNSYAQTFVSAILRKLWETDRLTMRDFLYFVQAAPRAELQELLADTAAAGQLASERTFGSIRTIAGNYVTSYDYLPTDKEKFSVAEMIRAEHSGFLFLTYRDDQLDSLRNLMACLLDVAARTILSLEEDPNRRIWLVIDEFASLGRVQSIEAVATKARKAGGCLVLGIQSVSQLKDRYGDNGAQTILSCLSSWLVLRCSDADTAEYMSKYMGDAEVRRTQKGQSNSDSGETQSWNEQSAIQRVVLGSQVQAFPNLTGLLKLAGDYPVCEVKLPIPSFKGGASVASFRERDFKANPLLKLAPSVPSPAKVAAPEQPASGAPRMAPTPTREDAVLLDKTPRPVRPPRNLLVEVSRNIKPLSERVAQLPVAEAREPIPLPSAPEPDPALRQEDSMSPPPQALRKAGGDAVALQMLANLAKARRSQALAQAAGTAPAPAASPRPPAVTAPPREATASISVPNPEDSARPGAPAPLPRAEPAPAVAKDAAGQKKRRRGPGREMLDGLLR